MLRSLFPVSAVFCFALCLSTAQAQTGWPEDRHREALPQPMPSAEWEETVYVGQPNGGWNSSTGYGGTYGPSYSANYGPYGYGSAGYYPGVGSPYGNQPLPVSGAYGNCPQCSAPQGTYPVSPYPHQFPQYPVQQYPQYPVQQGSGCAPNGWCGTTTGTTQYRYPNAGYGVPVSYQQRAPYRGGLFGLGLFSGWR